MPHQSPINIVWIKRDIRTWDHAAFDAAEKENIPYLPIFIFEPSLMQHPDCSSRHLQFQYLSILESNKKLSLYNKEIQVFEAEVHEVFDLLNQYFQIIHVFSYQESGIQLTYDRDIRMGKRFKQEQLLIRQRSTKSSKTDRYGE